MYSARRVVCSECKAIFQGDLGQAKCINARPAFFLISHLLNRTHLVRTSGVMAGNDLGLTSNSRFPRAVASLLLKMPSFKLKLASVLALFATAASAQV